jgi:hypothetical protein
VFDGKPLVRPGVKDLRLGEEVSGYWSLLVGHFTQDAKKTGPRKMEMAAVGDRVFTPIPYSAIEIEREPSIGSGAKARRTPTVQEAREESVVPIVAPDP